MAMSWMAVNVEHLADTPVAFANFTLLRRSARKLKTTEFYLYALRNTNSDLKNKNKKLYWGKQLVKCRKNL
jgi:hypothetical protein